MQKLSNQPPKGTADWFPEEFAVRKYIFDTWRQVCLSFGYQEYLTPIIESAEIYKAKSGEDVGGKELTVFTDRGGRELAIRPEMTPSVTRMITRKYESMPKPVKLFSIANFFRNENPQKGRNREFWQLNYDVFGSDSIYADIEVLNVAATIMQKLGATKSNFVIYVNSRQLIQSFITQYLNIDIARIIEATRIVDKFGKISEDDFISSLEKLGAKIEDRTILINFLNLDEAAMEYMLKDEIPQWGGYEEFREINANLIITTELFGIVRYNPSMVRGFDYYDGLVFEVFSLGNEGRATGRSLFGGGRYNGLAGIFGSQNIPAVGAAPGDETLKLFLEEQNLLPQLNLNSDLIFIPLLDQTLGMVVGNLAAKLRAEGFKVQTGFEVQKIGKALDYASKQGIRQVAILGMDELAKKVYKLKDMQSGAEQEKQL
jgi:histidyl-tRNA synthetase